jgi:hypothetical protein
VFNANDIPSDFVHPSFILFHSQAHLITQLQTLSNEEQDASPDSGALHASVPNDNGVSSPFRNKSAQQSTSNDGNIAFQQCLLSHEGDFDEHGDSDDFIDQATWEDEDWESDEEELDEPDPDWDQTSASRPEN